MSIEKKQKLFYGWIIVGACLVIQAIPFGVAQNIQPQFIHYVIKGENFTLTQFNILFTIGIVVAAVVSPFIGSLYDNKKVNKKMLYLIGGLLCGGGFALFGFCKELWQYYLVSALVQIGVSFISAMGVPNIINAWFGDKKGVPLSIAFAGGGIGNIFLQSISAYLIPKVGYSKAYVAFGIVSLIVSIPVVIIFIRFPKKGELELDINNKQKAANNIPRWGYTLTELKSNKMFWLFCIAWVFVGIYVSGEVMNYVAYFQTLNYGTIVGILGSTLAVCSIIGNLSGGKLFEVLGIRNALIWAGILITICGISLILSPYSKVFCFIFVICVGLSVFSYIIGPSYLTGALFGNKFYGTILGIISVFFAIGNAVGAPFFGVLSQYLGETNSWIIITIDSIIAYSVLVVSSIYFIKKVPEMKIEERKLKLVHNKI